ncbi:MAG: lactate utilization protein [Erysipelotrichaceae bacterium]|nr:lactate utilization protein [Erysipelotrichaceae bacterium]MDY5251736.1 lactate utilization protein [Erysipelotrichaceae bacterium]
MDNIEICAQKLEENRFGVKIFDTAQEVLAYLQSQLHGSVGTGGSVSLEQIGLIDWLRQADLTFYDRQGCEDLEALFAKMASADCYVTSTNAVTMEGGLYNVDGRGNRVAALTHGPKKVYVVAGKNKITADLPAAIKRVEEVAAVKNCQRLNKNAPCVKIGHCVHCNFDDTICSSFVYTRRSHIPMRIEVLLVREELGY